MSSTTTPDSEQIREAVRARYGALAEAESATGCCGPGCCGDGAQTSESAAIGYTEADLASVPAEADLGLGCGNPTGLASLAEGETVLDLGAGGGIDCFLASERVGPRGRVIGVDMTPEMVSRARRNAAAGGYTNVEFRLGEIEALPVADASVDAILSNCVLNLSPQKERVLAEARRVLRPDGRMIISDLVSDQAPPERLQSSLDALTACLPTTREAYLASFEDAGFDVRIVEERPFPMEGLLADPRAQQLLADLEPKEITELRAFAASVRGAVFEAQKR